MINNDANSIHNNLIHWANKANYILEGNKTNENHSVFWENKEALKELFKNDAPTRKDIRLRLYVLDSLRV